jgi:hypothetical protein
MDSVTALSDELEDAAADAEFDVPARPYSESRCILIAAGIAMTLMVVWAGVQVV